MVDDNKQQSDTTTDEAATIQQLLERATATHITEDDEASDIAYAEFMKVANELRTYGLAAVEAAGTRFDNGDIDERSTMADLFARLEFESPADIHEACFQRLADAIVIEKDAEVLSSVASAFGHLYDQRSVPLLLAIRAHPSENVRFAVAAALPSACNWEARDDAVAGLVELTRDTDDDVRDWSCFGLGQLHADGEDIRAALADRLDDPHTDTREEALTALAALGDQRAVERLLVALTSNDVSYIEIEAAANIADPRLHELLVAVNERRAGDASDDEKLEFAIRRCDPNAVSLAQTWEHELLEVLGPKAIAVGATVEIDKSYPLTTMTTRRNGETIYTGRVWDYRDPVTPPSAEVTADSWILTIGDLER